ncbi:MAG TPA: aldose 1-epimerase family protein [Atribacteraceae bacterium]|nr:aldose 1-epimerase family protein [Atribacteraceae bacterium]
MALINGKVLTREEILRRVGDISQLGGVRSFEYNDGPEKGVRAVEVNSGGGLSYTVLVDRGMDLASTFYKGVSLSWRSATGNLAPSFFEPAKLGWLRGFHGGLMNTCGLSYAGAPGIDKSTLLFLDEEEFGLHGRASYIPASNVYADGLWQGDDYLITVSGKVKEAVVFGDKLVLFRKIFTRLGEKSILIEDEVINEGWQDTPCMLLYHINVGYPILDEGSEYLVPVEKTVARDAQAADGEAEWNRFHAPQKEYFEKVYLHTPRTLADGNGAALLLNQTMELGFYAKFNTDALPYLTQWKMLGEGEYVLGIEPGNCFPLGRKAERGAGRLVVLKPGQSWKVRLELGVVDGTAEIAQFRKYMGLA